MAILKPFRGFRPPRDIAARVAARPYDVLNSDEARGEAEGNEYSLLHVTKPEIDLAPGIDEHLPEVYEQAKSNFEAFKTNGWLVQDDAPTLYIYAQTFWGKTQYGIVGCASVEDYLSGVIRKHELTRKDKEEDRMKHVRITNANLEPVFFSYPAHPELDELIIGYAGAHEPEYDFVADDGVGHHFWVIRDPGTVTRIVGLFEAIPATYVADGHHRTAAAALVGNEKKLNNPSHGGDEEYNYFLAVHFPDTQLTIIDYNRVVRDLNGMSAQAFLEQLGQHFTVERKGGRYKPDCLHNFGLYLEHNWYSLTAKPGTYDDNDPIGGLDVTVLSSLVLDRLLGIKDLRTDRRIDFVGGIRGLEELERRVDSGEMQAAFALYPVSMQQLIAIADSGNIMPPKTTWFEPKLRSGLVVHALD